MEEFKDCFFEVYEYKFTYDNEIYIADYCYSNRYGTYCEKDGITYHNVVYSSTFIGCNDNQNKINVNNIKFFRFLLVLLLIFCLFKIFRLFIGGIK